MQASRACPVSKGHRANEANKANKAFRVTKDSKVLMASGWMGLTAIVAHKGFRANPDPKAAKGHPAKSALFTNTVAVAAVVAVPPATAHRALQGRRDRLARMVRKGRKASRALTAWMACPVRRDGAARPVRLALAVPVRVPVLPMCGS